MHYLVHVDAIVVGNLLVVAVPASVQQGLVLFVLVLLRFGSRPERSSPVPPTPETLASSGRR